MAFSNTHFYHTLTRQIIVAFGVLFRDIKILKPDGAFVTVPLAYGSKNKWYSRLRQNPDLLNPNSVTLPRIGFKIDSFGYDTDRKLSSTTKLGKRNPVDPDVMSTIYQTVPWNIDISMFIWAKNIDDGLQIVEQIIPFFKPSFNITVQELHSVFQSLRDVPITLTSITMTEESEGSYEDFRVCEWDLTFSVKMNYHGPIRDNKIIKHVIIDTHLPNRDYPSLDDPNISESQVDERYSAIIDPFDASIVDAYEILESLEVLPVDPKLPPES